MIEDVTAKQEPPDAEPAIQDAISPVRLHGEACIHCGTTEGPLTPAGHRYTASGQIQLGWAVVACSEHAEVPR